MRFITDLTAISSATPSPDIYDGNRTADIGQNIVKIYDTADSRRVQQIEAVQYVDLNGNQDFPWKGVSGHNDLCHKMYQISKKWKRVNSILSNHTFGGITNGTEENDYLYTKAWATSEFLDYSGSSTGYANAFNAVYSTYIGNYSVSGFGYVWGNYPISGYISGSIGGSGWISGNVTNSGWFNSSGSGISSFGQFIGNGSGYVESISKYFSGYGSGYGPVVLTVSGIQYTSGYGFLSGFISGYAGNDPRGYVFLVPSSGSVYSGTPYCASVVPGMRFKALNASGIQVEGELIDVIHTGAGTVQFVCNVDLPPNSNNFRVIHDQLPFYYVSHRLYQFDGSGFPDMCHYCMPSNLSYIRTVKDSSLPITRAIAVSGSGDATACTYCEKADYLSESELVAYGNLGSNYICKNKLCQFYIPQHQIEVSSDYVNKLYLARAARQEVDSISPTLIEWWTRDCEWNGILRYLGVYLHNPFIAVDEEDTTVSYAYPFTTIAYSYTGWDSGRKTFFSDWKTLSRAGAGMPNDNVGVVAASSGYSIKRSPDGGSGYDYQTIPVNDNTAFSNFIGTRRLGWAENDPTNRNPYGLCENGVQRVRKRQVRSELLDITATGSARLFEDRYSSCIVRNNSGVEWKIPSFHHSYSGDAFDYKPGGVIHSYQVSGNVLKCYFEVGELELKTYSGDYTCWTGGNVVTGMQSNILDNPGSNEHRGDPEDGLYPGDRMDLGTYSFLCLDATPYASDIYHGSPVGSTEILGYVPYVHSYARFNKCRMDSGSFLISDIDLSGVTALVSSGTLSKTAAISHGAVMPNPAYYSGTVYWTKVDSTGNTEYDVTSLSKINPANGNIFVDLSSYYGQGYLFYDGYVFTREHDRPIENAYNIDKCIDNLIEHSYWEFGIPIGPLSVFQATLWDVPVSGAHIITSNIYTGGFGYLSAEDMGTTLPTGSFSVGSQVPQSEPAWITGPIPTAGAANYWTLSPGLQNPRAVFLNSYGTGVGAEGWTVIAPSTIDKYGSSGATYFCNVKPGYCSYTNGTGIQVFDPTVLSINPDEILEWKIVVRVKNGLKHNNSFLNVLHPNTSATPLSADWAPLTYTDSPAFYSSGWTETIPQLGADLVAIYPINFTVNDVNLQTGYVNGFGTSVSGYSSLGNVISAGDVSSNSYTDGSDTYTQVLIDITSQIKAMLSGGIGPGIQIGIRPRINSSSSIPIWRFNGPMTKTYTYMGVPATMSGCYENEAQSSSCSWDNVEVLNQFVKIDKSNLLDTSSDFHASADGPRVHGIDWLRRGF